MLKSLRPRGTGGLDEDRIKKQNAIRQLARVFRVYPLTYTEAVLEADYYMDMLTRRDADIDQALEEIKRLNLVVANCQRDIKDMKVFMAQYEIRFPEDKEGHE